MKSRFENADCEKTQAPIDEREFHQAVDALRKERAYANDCGGIARPMSSEEIVAELFKYHAPSDATIPKYAAINQAAKNFAEVILANCPSGRDRSVAIESIRVARMMANAAISLNGLSLF
jgi:hypothetical protein